MSIIALAVTRTTQRLLKTRILIPRSATEHSGLAPFQQILIAWPVNTGRHQPICDTRSHSAVLSRPSGGYVSVRCSSPIQELRSTLPLDMTFMAILCSTDVRVLRPTRAGLDSFLRAMGLLDPSPVAGELLLPRNYGRGPGIVMLNLRISKVFSFGPAGEGSVSTGGGRRGQPNGPFSVGGSGGGSTPTGHRYNLTISLSMRNILNHNNPGPIIGNIASPLFGLANQPYGVGTLGGTGFSESANNRRLELQTRFTF